MPRPFTIVKGFAINHLRTRSETSYFCREPTKSLDAPQHTPHRFATCLGAEKGRGMAMLYHAYEMSHAAISPMRAAARMGQEVISNPLQPDGGDLRLARRLRRARDVHERHAALRQAGVRARRHAGRRRRDPGRRGGRLVGALLQPPALPSRFARQPRRGGPEGADRGADVGPLRHAAARHRARHAARPRRLHHRLDRRPRGAGRARRLRPRRLHRLPDRDDRAPVAGRRAHRGDGGLPARHPGDGGGEPDGDGRQPAAPGRRWC